MNNFIYSSIEGAETIRVTMFILKQSRTEPNGIGGSKQKHFDPYVMTALSDFIRSLAFIYEFDMI